MVDWRIDRNWRLVTGDQVQQVMTSSLVEYQACCALGASGLGKTYELNRLQNELVASGCQVQIARFVEVGANLTAESLEHGLQHLAESSDSNTWLILDALDEAMIPIRMIGYVVANWIRNNLRERKPRLIISCRSAVWPNSIEHALNDVYGDDAVLAYLQPLSRDQQEKALSAEGIANGESFFTSVSAARAESLAEQPLTFRLLVKQFLKSGTMPCNRCELFSAAVQQLVEERHERHESGAAPTASSAEILNAAERLACFLLLSDRWAVTLGDDPVDGCLHHSEISGLASAGSSLNWSLLNTIARSGLSESANPELFYFAQRQFAEYLAGRRLARLPLHQSRALLASSAGWQAGVAGPLRETAAFAAGHSREIAQWIAETDPEVIGLSDVADDETRRVAVLGLLEQCRLRRITDADFFRDRLLLDGLKYANAVVDLKPVLKERHDGSEDVLECAIRMIQEWNLVELCDDLAKLALDRTAPLGSRKTAAYAIREVAPLHIRKQMKPLLKRGKVAPDQDLKGAALHCNWPENLSTRELLAALTPRKRNNYYGSYESFLWRLVDDAFDAADCRVEGLKWARLQFAASESDFEPLYKIAQRILHSALSHLDDPATATEVLNILDDTIKRHDRTPMEAIERYRTNSSGDPEPEPHTPLAGQQKIRRQLLELLIEQFPDPEELRWLPHTIPDLLVLEDFGWLLERATNDSRPLEVRTRYAAFAWHLSWMENSACVEQWLHFRAVEPVSTALCVPLFVELTSEEADNARKQHELIHGRREARIPPPSIPPPAERVSRMLKLAETESPLFFRGICRELSLKSGSRHDSCERVLTASPGWQELTDGDRQRVLKAAQAYLMTDVDDPNDIRKSPLNTIHITAMAAIWLVQELSPDWLDDLPVDWWKRWSWYILREQRLHLMDERNEPKLQLFGRLHQHVPDSVRRDVLRLATGQFRKQIDAAKSLLNSTLELLLDISDELLDEQLCQRIQSGKVIAGSLCDVAQFVLRRAPLKAAEVIIPLIRAAKDATPQSNGAQLVLALLFEQPVAHWNDLHAFLHKNPKAAGFVFGQFAGDRHRPQRPMSGESFVQALGPMGLGQLVELLFESFPPDTDPRREGAGFLGPDDEARMLRDRLLNQLTEVRDGELAAVTSARVTALRQLEAKYGKKYPWLRRPRAQAERSFRLLHRTSIPVSTIAEILVAADRRLIRTSDDAIDGIATALESLERASRHSSPSILRRFWNTPTGAAPSPKEEEFVSDEVCLAIRQYFESFAVTGDREVQLHRRQIPTSDGGQPGSLVDLFVTIPPSGSSTEQPIVVPIEVKLSCNPEAKTALNDQLADRYMVQAGTDVGVYVVAWYAAANLKQTHQPIWDSIAQARADLEGQAEQLRIAESLNIRVVLIDLSLL